MNSGNRNFVVSTIFIWAIIIVAIIFIAIYVFAPSSTPPVVVVTTPTPAGQSISDGTVTLHYSSEQFGLAVNKSQVLVNSYIPPCTEGFSYCLYYNAGAYQGTNFESAGVSMQKRTDLKNENSCITNVPNGFASSISPTAKNSGDGYTSSVFSPVGDAAAGHYAAGSIYRLFVKDSTKCYEFETRIGESQYLNYPAGTIKEFTSEDRMIVAGMLRTVIDAVSVGTNSNLFPKI